MTRRVVRDDCVAWSISQVVTGGGGFHASLLVLTK
jgi:hypothetical protein